MWHIARLLRRGEDFALTVESYKLAGIDSVKSCSTLVTRLKRANIAQDSGQAMNELSRHYNQAPDRFNGNVNTAKADYSAYIRREIAEFSRLLRGGPLLVEENCGRAADALGRLTHTWQDYFAHAVLMSGAAGPAWTASPAIRGTPDSQNPNLKPSGWGSAWTLDLDEHGSTEPAYRDGDGQARKVDAVVFVRNKLRTYLHKWGHKCHCFCAKQDF